MCEELVLYEKRLLDLLFQGVVDGNLETLSAYVAGRRQKIWHHLGKTIKRLAGVVQDIDLKSSAVAVVVSTDLQRKLIRQMRHPFFDDSRCQTVRNRDAGLWQPFPLK